MGEADAISKDERAALRAALGEASVIPGAEFGNPPSATFHEFQEDFARRLGPAVGRILGIELSATHRWAASLDGPRAVSELPAPAIRYEFIHEPDGSVVTLALDPRFAGALAERLMGAPWPDAGRSERPPGETERGILLPLIARLFEALREAWPSRGDAGPEAASEAIRPGSPSWGLVRPADRVTASRFELDGEGRRGSFYLLFPDSLARHLGDPGSVLLSFRWPMHRLAGSGSTAMREGDVLIAAHAVGAPGLVLAGGRARFTVSLGRLRGLTAVRMLDEVATTSAKDGPPDLEWRSSGRGNRPATDASKVAVEFALDPWVLPSVQVGRLAPGLVVTLDSGGPDLVRIRLAGKPAARGVPGRVGTRFAVRLTRVAPSLPPTPF